MQSRTKMAAAIGIAVAGGAAPADAELISPDPDATTISLGGAAVYKPEFQGADENETVPFPLINVRNLFGFNLAGTGLSYDLLRKRGTDRRWEVAVGPSLSLDLGREEDDSPFLNGLGDIDSSLLAGGFLRARYGPVMLNVSGGQDVADGHDGALIGLRLGVMVPLGRRLRLTPGVSATWASEDYMQSYFGITGAQAAGSIYAPFSPEAGFKDVGVNLNVTYAIAGNWSATARVAYTRLVGDSADSPIVEGPGGSENQVTALLGISYRFTY